MKIMRDAATLGILILLALTVRIDFGDESNDFGGVRAGTGEPALEGAQDPGPASSEGLTAELSLEAQVRSIAAAKTVLPIPDGETRVEDIGNGRILIIIEEEAAVEDGSEFRPPAAPESPPCKKLQAHRSC